MKNKKWQWRPPISEKRQEMLDRISSKLNEDATHPFTRHNTLDLAIDRAYMAMFPNDKDLPKRKKYIKWPF